MMKEHQVISFHWVIAENGEGITIPATPQPKPEYPQCSPFFKTLTLQRSRDQSYSTLDICLFEVMEHESCFRLLSSGKPFHCIASSLKRDGQNAGKESHLNRYAEN